MSQTLLGFCPHCNNTLNKKYVRRHQSLARGGYRGSCENCGWNSFRKSGAINAIDQAWLYKMMKDDNVYGVDMFIRSNDDLKEEE